MQIRAALPFLLYFSPKNLYVIWAAYRNHIEMSLCETLVVRIFALLCFASTGWLGEGRRIKMADTNYKARTAFDGSRF